MADFNFKGVTAIRLPEGLVTEVKDAEGNLLWRSNANSWTLKEAAIETLIETIANTSRITCYSTIDVSSIGTITLSGIGLVSPTIMNATYPYYKGTNGIICRRSRGVTSGTGFGRKLAIYGYVITAVQE